MCVYDNSDRSCGKDDDLADKDQSNNDDVDAINVERECKSSIMKIKTEVDYDKDDDYLESRNFLGTI